MIKTRLMAGFFIANKLLIKLKFTYVIAIEAKGDRLK